MKKVYLKEFKIYQKDYKKSFLWTIVFFIIIAIVCFKMSMFMADFFIIQTKEIAKSIANDIAEISGKEINELTNMQTFLVIFWNNLKVATIVMVLGLIPLYRLPSLFVFLQFIMIGVVFAGGNAMGHNVMHAFIFSFLPHALFELTAVIYGVEIGNFINRNIIAKIFFRNKKNSKPIGELIKQSLRSYILIVLPLLFIAALMEGFITPKL